MIIKSNESTAAETNVTDQTSSVNPAEHIDGSSQATTLQQAQQEEDVASEPIRDPNLRPVYKLSVRLIDTYKNINRIYYEAKAKRLRESKDSARGGVHNEGYDDQNYDYILVGDEVINDRYVLKHKMGKGSFGQVVSAYDNVNKCEVAIKIIKSRKPFLIQAKTEIDILTKIIEKDSNDEGNIVRMIDEFVYRNHQCLVFELLSFNLYELLKNTKFRGVSLSLIRKFSRQLIKSLELLSREDVNIIHCDLKPENILLRHPRRSAIKLIDFGSSCYLTKRTYTYIQSRFYRSPEVLLGLPYSQKIDMWSLGCVVVEMHTGEPLFGGSNQLDQMGRIIDILGMPPLSMIKASPEKVRAKFFERIEVGSNVLPSSSCDSNCIVYEEDKSAYYILKRSDVQQPKKRTLQEIIGVYTGGPSGRRADEKVDHTVEHYLQFLDFVEKLLVYDPQKRASPLDLVSHGYLISSDPATAYPPTLVGQAPNNNNVTATTTVGTSISNTASNDVNNSNTSSTKTEPLYKINNENSNSSNNNDITTDNKNQQQQQSSHNNNGITSSSSTAANNNNNNNNEVNNKNTISDNNSNNNNDNNGELRFARSNASSNNTSDSKRSKSAPSF